MEEKKKIENLASESLVERKEKEQLQQLEDNLLKTENKIVEDSRLTDTPCTSSQEILPSQSSSQGFLPSASTPGRGLKRKSDSDLPNVQTPAASTIPHKMLMEELGKIQSTIKTAVPSIDTTFCANLYKLSKRELSINELERTRNDIQTTLNSIQQASKRATQECAKVVKVLHTAWQQSSTHLKEAQQLTQKVSTLQQEVQILKEENAKLSSVFDEEF